MTNEQVKESFHEVYNEFWLNYRDKYLPKESEEWERMNTWGSVLIKKYPFMEVCITAMIAECDQRRKEEDKKNE